MMGVSWVDLLRLCPIDLTRVKHYYDSFATVVPETITDEGIDSAKEGVLHARGYLDSMFTSLIQLLYDQEILRKSQDKILFMWMSEDIGRFLGFLDEEEYDKIIKVDSPSDSSRLGIARISGYSKRLSTIANSIIYESLLKSTEEYGNLPKDKKDKRAFLYILFQVMRVTMSINGGIARMNAGKKVSKRFSLSTFPTSTQGLMSSAGGELIKKGYEEETGQDLSKMEESIQELYDEFDEGGEDDTEDNESVSQEGD